MHVWAGLIFGAVQWWSLGPCCFLQLGETECCCLHSSHNKALYTSQCDHVDQLSTTYLMPTPAYKGGLRFLLSFTESLYLFFTIIMLQMIYDFMQKTHRMPASPCP